MALLNCDLSLHCILERKKEIQKHKAKARSSKGEQWERFRTQRQKQVNEKSAKGWLLTNIVKLLVHQCKHEPRCMANHADAIDEITILTIQFLRQPNCAFARAYIGTPGLFGMLRVFSFAINTRDCGNALCGQFFR